MYDALFAHHCCHCVPDSFLVHKTVLTSIFINDYQIILSKIISKIVHFSQHCRTSMSYKQNLSSASAEKFPI